jgi:predicted phage terminase large subunit-like protein
LAISAQQIREAKSISSKAPLTFKQFIAIVRPSYKWSKFSEILAERLQEVADGKIKRLMVFMPPRHGKSELVSRLFPAYFLYRFPYRFVGLASYSQGLANTLSRAAKSNYNKAVAEIAGLSALSTKSVKQWETDAGGGFWCCGVGGEATGKGLHLGIVDDPLKNAEQAASLTIKEKQRDWWSSTFYTREQPTIHDDFEAAFVVVQTRWDEGDLAGWLLSAEAEAATNEDEAEYAEKWHIINLPALAEEEPQKFPSTCTVEPDWRQPGEALWPEVRDVKKLRRICKRVGTRIWASLFQQRPAPAEGAIFKKGWFGYYKQLPPMKAAWGTWDTALKAKEKNDESANVIAGEGEDGNCYIMGAAHGHWETPALAKWLVDQARWYRNRYGETWKGDYVEDKVSGTTMMQFVRKSDPDVMIIPIQVDGDKVARAHGVSPLCETGRVLFPDPDQYPATRKGIEDLINNLLFFPNGASDDLTDAFVYALKRFLGTLRVAGQKPKKERERKGSYY